MLSLRDVGVLSVLGQVLQLAVQVSSFGIGSCTLRSSFLAQHIHCHPHPPLHIHPMLNSGSVCTQLLVNQLSSCSPAFLHWL